MEMIPFIRMPMIKNIIFDWSGTLSDDITPVYKAIMFVFKESGAKKISFKEFRMEFELPYMNFYKKYNIVITKQESDRIFDNVFNFKELKPFAQAKEVLDFLHKKGIRTAILSSHPQKFLEKEVEDFGFRKYFMDIVGGVHNKTEVINEIMKKNRFLPKETAYVGDMTHDIEAGKKAGVITIAACYGYQSKEKLSKEKPDFLIKELTELKNIIS